MAKLLEKIIKLEIASIKCGSKSEALEFGLRFSNSTVPDRYSDNYTLFIKQLSDLEISRKIENEISARVNSGKTFCKLVFLHKIQNKIIELPNYACTTDKVNYMSLDLTSKIDISGNTDCNIVHAVDDATISDGVKAHVLANAPSQTEDFARRNILSMVDICKNPKLGYNFFVCYHKGNPIGKFLLFQLGDMTWLYDFDILPDYQNNGFGTQCLAWMVDYCRNQQCRYLALVAMDAENAKFLYSRCGFEYIGQRVEVFYDLKNPKTA